MSDNLFNLLYLLITGTGLGLGAAGAFRAVRNFRSDTTINEFSDTGDSLTGASIRKGASRSTNCLSLLPDGVIRLRNGNLVRGFWLEPHKSLWNSHAEVDNLFDELGGLLRANLPVGTGFQFRLAVHPDDTDYLHEKKIELIGKEQVHPIAQSLRLDQLDFYSWMSERGYFYRSRMTLWVTLPMKHSGENSRNKITETFNSLRKNGFQAFGQNATRGIVRRTVEEEQELMKKAAEYFSEIQQMCPLDISPMNRNETWQALYYGYNENAGSCPVAPSSPLIDLKPVLCSTENIRTAGNWYLLHGNTPVTMISLFVPPESDGIKRRGCYAGMMRYLANNADLRGRYTILTEFVTEEKEKTEAGLKRDKWALKIISTRPGGAVKPDKKKKKAHDEIDQIEEELVSGAENLVNMRFRILVYGDAATTNSELEASIKRLDLKCKKLIREARKRWRGADIALEDVLALRDLYEQTLIGNMDLKGLSGRELKEQTSSYCAFIPAEDSWKGMDAPHTIKRTITGKRFGINFWRNPRTKSPLVCILGAAGTGKSIEAGTYALDMLAEMPKGRVKIVDFGETYAPLCEVLGGLQHRLTPDETRAVNIWDYKGLESGEPPEEPQVTLVVEDAIILAGFDPDSDIGQVRSGILQKSVIEVYKDFVPRNRQPNGRRHEPTLTNLIHKLRYFPFATAEEVENAAQLASSLSRFEEHPWLDAVTHEDFRVDSPLEVFELDSLHLFPKTVRKALAFRVGSRVIRSIGEKIGGEYTPTMLIFDEMHEYNNPEQPELKVIFRAMEKGARKGRKTNVITILATHGYEDLAHLHGLTKTAGVYVVGKQDNVDMLKEARQWNDEIAAAVAGVESEPGSYSQFVINVGMGANQQSELIVSDLSPVVLWTMTSDPNERNAREKVKQYFPEFTTYDAVKWLAELYPRGLTYAGLTDINPINLPPLPVIEWQEPSLGDGPKGRVYRVTTAPQALAGSDNNFQEKEAIRSELTEITDDEVENFLLNIN